MKKRVLSMLMALTLCLTTLPTAVFADVTENGEGSGGTHYVAESGGTQYETVQEILDNMEEGEITLLDSVTEDLTVYAATTIHMNGHSITGNIDATDSLTLNGGTVDGTVKVYGGHAQHDRARRSGSGHYRRAERGFRLCLCQRRAGRREGHAVLRWHGYADLRRSEGGRAG